VKVLLIVFGSLFGLMIIAIIGVAIMLPILGKKLDAQSHDPATRARTVAKIADFRVPPGYRIQTATDMGITQSATIVPEVRSGHGAMMIQLSGQHVPTTSADASLDAMGTGLGLTAKFVHCDLKRGDDDDVRAGGKTIALRTYGCGDGSDGMHVEIGLMAAKASTVQIIATSMNEPFDKSAIDELVASIR
jgi:hypothetical protein